MDTKAKLMQQHCALQLRPEAFEEFRGIAITYTRDQELPLTAAAADDFTVGLLALYGLKLWPKSDDHRKHLVPNSGPSSGLVYRPLPTSHKKKDIVNGPRMYRDESVLRSEHGKTPWSDLTEEKKQEWVAKAEKVVAFLNVKHEKTAREVVLKSELGVLLASYYLAMLEYPRGACVHNRPTQMVARITACVDSGAGKRGSPRKSTGKSVSGVAEASSEASPLGDAHAALFLRPAMFEMFKALVVGHTQNTGLHFSADARQQFTISFITAYAHILWPRDKDGRQHLVDWGIGGPMFTSVLEQILPEAIAKGLNGFQMFRKNRMPASSLENAKLQPLHMESAVHSAWHLLPSVEKEHWESQACMYLQAREREWAEERLPKVLSSRLGKLLTSYFTALLGCEPFEMVNESTHALLTKIRGRNGKQTDKPQQVYHPYAPQAVHEQSMASAPVTDVASFWTKFEQETE
ncbi:hypothetical protein LTR10_007875 [Elasticomyces elasticus]|nr:hypothetical protein LTR10_007875 [Elasticomyces elasticus]KAK4970875.1 hypothetical protein LTR42_007852 [Elasticomyces elasticus]